MSIIAACGAAVCITALMWFIARGFRDYAFPDIVLFLTGISIIAYAFTRWDRAKLPLLLALAGFVIMLVGAGFADSSAYEESFNNGIKAIEEEDYDLAILSFSESLAIVPGDSASLHNRAMANLHKGNHKAALADATEAILISPGQHVLYAV